MPDTDCSWCGGEIEGRGFSNRRGEAFCCPGHRTASNRALQRLLDRERAGERRRDTHLRDNARISARSALAKYPPGTKCGTCGSAIRGRPPYRCKSWEHLALYFAKHLTEEK